MRNCQRIEFKTHFAIDHVPVNDIDVGIVSIYPHFSFHFDATNLSLHSVFYPCHMVLNPNSTISHLAPGVFFSAFCSIFGYLGRI